jgi:hypothetical protein
MIQVEAMRFSIVTIYCFQLSARAIMAFSTSALSESRMNMKSHSSRNPDGINNNREYKTIYGVPRSGWESPIWNWGSAVGTGHDCAKICRQKYSSLLERQELVDRLLAALGDHDDIPSDFEEVKLVLALSWQRGRWDGTDGGEGGYSEVLHQLVLADRYEYGSELEWSQRWIEDMQKRFHRLRPSSTQITSMQNIVESVQCYNSNDSKSFDDSIVYSARRRCSGLVLQAMGFIENGC